MSVTIDALDDPFGATVSASGTCALGSTVSVAFTDSTGAGISVAAVIVGTGWSVTDADVSTLVDGTVVASATETPTAGPLAFAAKAATKRTTTRTHVTCQPWATHLDVAANFAPITAAEIDEACWAATDILYALTGSRWPGVCSDVVRPQARFRQSSGPPRWWQAAQNGARWPYGWCSCNRGRDFGCALMPEIVLPRVADVETIVVKIDGAVFGDWALIDGRSLVRTDGSGWPCCQKTWLPDTEVGTWSVAYSFGKVADGGGVLAAAALGYQLALAYFGDDKCKLPRRVRSVTRGQTTIAVLDPLTLFKDGLVGLTEVDLWVMSKMLGTKRSPATIGVVGRGPQHRRS